MDLDLSKAEEYKTIVINCLKEMIEYFPEAIEGSAANPAVGHLF